MKDLRRPGIAMQHASDGASGPGTWWTPLFYGLPALLGPLAKLASFAGGAGVALQYVLTLAGFALSIWGFVEIGCLPRNGYGPNPILQAKRAGRSS
jgi:hypothetical protein